MIVSRIALARVILRLFFYLEKSKNKFFSYLGLKSKKQKHETQNSTPIAK